MHRFHEGFSGAAASKFLSYDKQIDFACTARHANGDIGNGANVGIDHSDDRALKLGYIDNGVLVGQGYGKEIARPVHSVRLPEDLRKRFAVMLVDLFQERMHSFEIFFLRPADDEVGCHVSSSSNILWPRLNNCNPAE
jgi:hypothetical protein